MALIDFKNVSSDNALPEGRYQVEVENIEFREDKNYYNWTFKVISAIDPENEGKYAGRKVWECTSLKENALWKLKSYLLALGADEVDLENEFNFEAADYIGMTSLALITQREYNSKVVNSVDLVAEECADGLTLFN